MKKNFVVIELMTNSDKVSGIEMLIAKLKEVNASGLGIFDLFRKSVTFIFLLGSNFSNYLINNPTDLIEFNLNDFEEGEIIDKNKHIKVYYHKDYIYHRNAVILGKRMKYNIISGEKFELITNNSKVRLDPYYKEFDGKNHPKHSSQFTFIITTNASEKIMGIGESNIEKRLTWHLESEVKGISIGYPNKNFFRFESFDELNGEIDFYINTSDFLDFLEYLSQKTEKFDIELLYDTIVLHENEAIIKKYNEFKTKKTATQNHTKPKEYYEKEYGNKSLEEEKLWEYARNAKDFNGTHEGSGEAIDFYSDILKINPKNAFAYFYRGLAIMDYWVHEKNFFWLTNREAREVKEKIISKMEIERIERAQHDFKIAIGFNPYLIENYERLKKQGRIK